MHVFKNTIKNDFKKKLMCVFAEEVEEASKLHKYIALGRVIREYISEAWLQSKKRCLENDKKQVYYFSMEFLTGKLLESNLINLGIKEECNEALNELGINLDELLEIEKEAGLGNGGLGRLAACFLDSMASIGVYGHGNGIRYRYGLFEQKIVNGYQVEIPDKWLKDEFVWVVKRRDKSVIVKFGGNVKLIEKNGRLKAIHENYEPIKAVPYDVPVVGYEGNVVNTLRLWSAEPVGNEFDFFAFRAGEYLKAVEYKYNVESISQVLYPDDSNHNGRVLRLKQQYFFVSAGIQSILRTFKKTDKEIYDLPDYVAIHVNDTHPSVAVAELMRILVDEYELGWEEAWKITTKTIAYTNHTIMAEALETWPVDMFRKLLPRVYMIVEEIDRRFKIELHDKYNEDWDKINSTLIIHDGNIRMANLAIVGSYSVNGVSKLHTEILKNRELKHFSEIFPKKFNNKTNGITHRRWLLQSNPLLADLITDTIGNKWITQPNRLKDLEQFVKDKAFKEEIKKVKQKNKEYLCNFINDKYNILVDQHSIFDVQAKRLHAYKRQLLNGLHILNLYNRIKENPNLDIVPRTFIFAAKASPGYHLAKQIIKFINSLKEKINNDKSIKDNIKIVFLENYNVTLAERLIPSANVSEQISTASKEASGTGNMKFMMNGGITLGTLDGANIEIKESVGSKNIITFGLTADQVMNYYRHGGYFSMDVYNNDQRLKKIITQLTNGFLDVPNEEFKDIFDHLITYNDEFFVLKDFDSYVEAQNKVDKLYKKQDKWSEMSIINIANSGKFSSDNTIKEYVDEIWRA
ncbi:glycogen/starch/alpha-glucan phosphorylase [Caldisalinibacter kiritimatiensis]|uniref:Alpha-1,4 glucan phosphorylase n=1 Tax=Caldisalinibacter kiritimatiensis TaxID=1304284 RepID=R1AV70_9FIRM|nr:glycogen/starch/alpha-glucan phosphorylase [Caldisalinibacter kiritimatiensis]EOD00532.1 Glycogen phosphorylase [Caldisalinibacter kiritimatiensis]